MLQNDEKKLILEYRQRGYGYKSIATVVGVSRDSVRNLCKSHGLDGYLRYGISRPYQKLPDLPDLREYPEKCEYCGKEINTEYRRGRKSRFCSDRCRRTWWNENSDKKDRRETAWYSFVCLYCGKDFKAYGNKNRKYCSRRCTIEHRYGSYKEKTGYQKRKELHTDAHSRSSQASLGN